MEITSAQIEAWVARNFPDYKKHSGGRQLVINNPFDGDTGRHFWISTYKSKSKSRPGILTQRDNYWVHDFRPGNEEYNSSFINFVRRYRKISYHQAISEVCGKDASSLREKLRALRNDKIEEQEEEKQEKIVELPPLSHSFAEKDSSRVRELALNYLQSRGVILDQAIALNIHYTPTTIVFPYMEYGMLVYWQERDILGKRFNFPNEEKTGLAKTDFLYNFDNVEPHDYVVIVESIFNCISLGNNCVATGGAIMSGKQFKKLEYLAPKLVILAPDFDEAGIKSIRNNYFALCKNYKIAYCLPPEELLRKGKKDWNDLEVLSGPGVARKYVESKAYELNVSIVARLNCLLQKCQT